ncbi:unannotated protein [freshwater metagenome]|uniref:Unannotated protein n=1 Tax=freshwater metagenome TaxID=449393 RepID=A0A6J7NK29_9ZZZZ
MVLTVLRSVGTDENSGGSDFRCYCRRPFDLSQELP